MHIAVATHSGLLAQQHPVFRSNLRLTLSPPASLDFPLQPAMQENSSSTRSWTIPATCVVGWRCHSVCVGRVTPPTTTHGNPSRRFAKHRLSWTIVRRRSYLPWYQRNLKLSLEESKATQLDNKSTPFSGAQARPWNPM